VLFEKYEQEENVAVVVDKSLSGGSGSGASTEGCGGVKGGLGDPVGGRRSLLCLLDNDGVYADDVREFDEEDEEGGVGERYDESGE